MIQTASGEQWVAAVTHRLAQQPEALETGLVVVDHQLPLTMDVLVDLVLRDPDSQLVLVLVDAGEDGCLMLARALGVMAEARRSRPLLDRLYRREMVSLGGPPRIVLLVRHFPTRGQAALLGLSGVPLEVHQAIVTRIAEEDHLIVLRPGGAPMAVGAPSTVVRPASADPSPENGAAKSAAPAAPAAPSAPPGATPASISVDLHEEAKRRILRISDGIEEEVDGELIRFLVHERVLAVLADGDGGFGLYVGDQPHRRRAVESLADLNAALDDVFRRYYELTRTMSRGSTES